MSARTIKDLTKLEGRVYLYFADEAALEQFIQAAELEHVQYRDGVSLRDRRPDSYMALNADGTVNFLGFAGRMAYGIAGEVGGQKLIRIDYAKYAAGYEDYIISQKISQEAKLAFHLGGKEIKGWSI